jgi:hypothetical protein
MARMGDVPNWFSRAEYAEHGVVEALRTREIIGTEHHVVEHGHPR